MNMFKLTNKSCLSWWFTRIKKLFGVKPILNILQSAFRNDNCILPRYNQEMINGHFIFGFYPNFQYLGEID